MQAWLSRFGRQTPEPRGPEAHGGQSACIEKRAGSTENPGLRAGLQPPEIVTSFNLFLLRGLKMSVCYDVAISCSREYKNLCHLKWGSHHLLRDVYLTRAGATALLRELRRVASYCDADGGTAINVDAERRVDPNSESPAGGRGAARWPGEGDLRTLAWHHPRWAACSVPLQAARSVFLPRGDL